PRPDVQHGYAAAAWLAGTEGTLSAEDRQRRIASAIDGRHRTDHGHRYDEDQDDGGAARRPLRGERPERLDFARPAFGPDDSAGAYHAAFGCAAQVGRHVDLYRRSARSDRSWSVGAADHEYGQS